MIVRPITLHDFDPLTDAMAEDGHYMAYPTHVAERDGVFIGCASVGVVPVVSFYMHTKRARARESWRMAEYCEGVVRKAGAPAVCVPCEKDSPLVTLARRRGFDSAGDVFLFVKKL